MLSKKFTVFFSLCVWFLSAAAYANKDLVELQHAAYKGDQVALIKTLATLKKKKININTPSSDPHLRGFNALLLAIYGNHPELVEVLLSNDADPDFVSAEDQFTPLMVAIKRGNQRSQAAVLDALKQKTKSITASLDRKLPMHLRIAAPARSKEELAQLAKIEDIYRAVENDGFGKIENPTLPALESVHELFHLESDPCLEAPYDGPSFGTALHLASAVCDLRLVEVLVEAGATVDAIRDLDHATPYRVALYLGCLDVANLLLKKGANPLKTASTEAPPILQRKLTKPEVSPGDHLAEKAQFADRIGRSLVAKNAVLARSLFVSYWHLKRQMEGKEESVDLPENYSGEELNSAIFSEVALDFAFDTTCSICTDEMKSDQDLAYSACRHAYHENCLSTWVEKAKCPVCSAPLSFQTAKQLMGIE